MPMHCSMILQRRTEMLRIGNPTGGAAGALHSHQTLYGHPR